MRYLILTAAVGVLAALGGCGDSIVGNTIPRIEVTEGQRPVLPNGTVTARAELPARILIGNTGTGSLMVNEIVIESSPAGAFSIISLPMPSLAAPIQVDPNALSHPFSVAYNPAAVTDGARASAMVRIRTNMTLNSATEFTFYVAPEVSLARLVVSPPILDFKTVSANATATQTSNLLNTGGASLAIDRILFAGHLGYTASIAGVTYNVTAESASTGILLNPPLTVAAGNSQKVDVTYTATGAEAAQGTLLFYTGTTDTTGAELKLFANLAGPCIKTNPTHVAFGGKLVGEGSEIGLDIESCGDVDLVINDIEMLEDANGVFGVNEAAVSPFPLTIAPSTRVRLPVTYFPSAVAQLGSDGQFVLDQGKLRISSNAYLAQLDVSVDGFGTSGECPVAKITVAEGDEVLPQTELHLSGTGSTAPSGNITAYEWTVVQPNGSQSTFGPSPYSASPTFEANVVGEYIFRLTVRDAFGVASCSPAEARVIVTSDEAIHVELLWHTPGDLDETDVTGPFDYASVGSDVDLHFLHPKAQGVYFDPIYDCYWRNTHPNWGLINSPSDDPSLDRDDTDGAGPENLNIDVPEQNVTYQVGVHYYDDWDYGVSQVTVRIYIYGVLRDQWDNVTLRGDDMWDTHTIDWPSTTVTRIGTSPQITPLYLGL